MAMNTKRSNFFFHLNDYFLFAAETQRIKTNWRHERARDSSVSNSVLIPTIKLINLNLL